MFHSTLAPRVSRTERAGLLLTLVLLMFAGIAALASLHGAPASNAAARPPAQPADRLTALHRLPPRERDGRTLVRLSDAGFLRVTVDRSDPALLHVLVPQGTAVADCNLIDARVSVLSQDATSVRLVASGWTYVPAASVDDGGTTCVQTGTSTVPVHLAAPLAGRAVYSGRATRATAVARD